MENYAKGYTGNHVTMLTFMDYTKQAVRLGGRHNMPPPRDLDF